MGKIKKILTLALTLVLTLGLSITSFATPKPTTGNITITNNPQNTGVSMVGHTYSAYKVFGLTSSGTNYAYIVENEFKEFFKSKASNQSEVNTDAKLNAFATKYIKEHTDINALAKELMGHIDTKNIAAKGNSGAVPNNTETAIINNLPLGYYVILDTPNGATGNASVVAATALQSIGKDTVINLKAVAPTVDKQIKHNETGNWGNVGDNQIGDTVEYRVLAKIPSNLTGYSNYTYILHDSLTAGLDFNNDVSVYIGDKESGGKKLQSEYYDVTSINNQKFNVSIKVMQGISDHKLNKGDTLYVYYTAKLNENAVIAGTHNDNKVELEYSNNPYGETTNKTPEVLVKDYTFKLNVLKTNGTNIALPGAEFEISIGNKEIYFKESNVDGINKYVVCTGNPGHPSEKECTKTIVSGTNGKFEIIGLDDTIEYTLTETKAPEGYNTIDPISFKITTEYDQDGNIISIKSNVDSIVKVEGAYELGTTIVNTSGNELPGTGGMGTTIFTVVGGGLMISASIVLIKRRRQGEKEE